jgi:hypothetical protein
MDADAAELQAAVAKHLREKEALEVRLRQMEAAHAQACPSICGIQLWYM